MIYLSKIIFHMVLKFVSFLNRGNCPNMLHKSRMAYVDWLHWFCLCWGTNFHIYHVSYSHLILSTHSSKEIWPLQLFLILLPKIWPQYNHHKKAHKTYIQFYITIRQSPKNQPYKPNTYIPFCPSPYLKRTMAISIKTQ